MDPLEKLIPDPLIVVDSSHAVLELNAHARALTGQASPARADDIFAVDSRYAALLTAASGTSGYVVGSLDVRMASGEVRRVTAHAVTLERGATPRFAIQLLVVNDNQFKALSQQVRELNREVGLRRRSQARLEEALALNETLYRELQHRVKNHLQMMLGLFSAAVREAGDPSHQALIRRLQAQLSAIVEAQRLMYLAENRRGVSAEAMLRSLAEVAPKAAGSDVPIICHTEPIVISNEAAFPLALIANELLLNALKHGTTSPDPKVELRLRMAQSEVRLEVQDNGPGLPPATPERRSSGLGLVRGLCRQMGARLDVKVDAGTLVTVSFEGEGL